MQPPTRSRNPILRIAITFTAAMTVLATLTAPAAPAAVDATIRVDLRDATPISERLYGIFYEDINHAADGGLYAELVQNRSFEFNQLDNPSYHGLTAWTVASGEATVDDAASLHPNNQHYLRTSAGTTIVNAGFNSGMTFEAGATYDFSVWVAGAGTLTASLTDAGGAALSAPVTIETRGDGWSKYEAVLTAIGDTIEGRLTITTAAPLRLDMVSLFPTDTWLGRENGLRPDLAQLIADLRPSFLRFPGGCIVNTGSFEPYPESQERAYHWKDTIGPVEQRPTNHNFWGYNQSYGLGYYEYFQFAEDIGAEPIPVVPVGVTGCGDTFEITDPAELQQWVDDTLDLIEFANGAPDTEWGSVRAAMGHPEPFGLEYIGLGNEESSPQFYENYPYFHEAIRQAHPEIQIISNSGFASEGPIFDRSWQFARELGADLVDEHYYNAPQWFFSNNHRYDDYDRAGPHVFIGEYASRSNTWWSALAEASYLTGVERNGDVVELASYAPLLSNIDYVNWAPDLIWFDNHQWVRSTNYEVQRLFSHHRGDQVYAATLAADPLPPPPDITGSIGLATWNTAAVYDDVRVTAADGTVLFEEDFSAGADRWTVTGPNGEPRGDWRVVDGAYQQTQLIEDARSVAGDPAWSNYTVELTARKLGGAEGFLIMFGVRGTGDYYWWNLGGWNNTTSAIEVATGGGKATLVNHDTTIETGRTYQLRLEVAGRRITGWIDGEQAFTVVDEQRIEPLYQVVTRNAETGAVTVKVVNARPDPVTTRVELAGRPLRRQATVTTIAAEPTADNVLGQDPVVFPVTHTEPRLGNRFTYEFAPYSVTFIELTPAHPR
ncbi:MAG TPA: alpha-L-arabinofuranosidase C-terminal domain-containing protein [Natronosporangium sp.]